MSDSSILEFLVRLESEVKDFKLELYRLCWFMRGGVQVNDLYDRYSYEDRELMYAIVKENFENSKEAQMPLI